VLAAGNARRSAARFLLDEVIDAWDGFLRRRGVDRLIADLIAGRISHWRAAEESRDLLIGEETDRAREAALIVT
jgi:hypothetical protein